MKALVIGSTSTIGRALASRLRTMGDVKMAGRRDADITIDLSRRDPAPAINESFDVVVHAAADFGGSTDRDFERAELVNAVGALSTCALAHQAGARHVVLISSLSATYRRGDPYYGIYALSKRHGEENAQFYCEERGLALTILRPSQIYDAAGACRRHQGLLFAIADRAQAGEDIHIHGTHDASRNYLFLDDMVEICSRVIADCRTGTFTCGYPQNVRLSDVIAAAYAAFDRGGTMRFDATKPDLADLPPVTESKLYDLISYRPQIDIDRGFERIRHHRERNS